jgi:hypothetical protein
MYQINVLLTLGLCVGLLVMVHSLWPFMRREAIEGLIAKVRELETAYGQLGDNAILDDLRAARQRLRQAQDKVKAKIEEQESFVRMIENQNLNYPGHFDQKLAKEKKRLERIRRFYAGLVDESGARA